MPWKETCAMDQRIKFISDWLSGHYCKTELCGHYGISRPTGDKWISRYQAEGVAGLKERSRTPRTHPNAVSEEICQRIAEVKLAHLHFGPKKVMDWLRRNEPGVAWPADSTAGEVLKRAGLVRPRRRRRRVRPYSEPFVGCERPNQSWSADFKGDFRLRNGQRCYPLTITDNFSRYLLACRGLSRTTHVQVRPWFEWVFREHGLPQAIRTDNGAPFASLALGGLTQLSKWWIRLGIRPERIRPGRPSENGRHERMHRSLEEGAVQPIQPDLVAQQRQMDAFVEEYNWERSHESLERRIPGQVHCASAREYPTRLPEIEYESDAQIRQVRRNGEIKWKGELVYVTEVLVKEPIGLYLVDTGLWEVRYSFHLLGVLDERTNTITPSTTWHGTT